MSMKSKYHKKIFIKDKEIINERPIDWLELNRGMRQGCYVSPIILTCILRSSC